MVRVVKTLMILSVVYYPMLLTAPYVQLAQTYDWHISLYISIPLIFAVAIGLSLLSYYYFEKPANRWVKRILNKQ